MSHNDLKNPIFHRESQIAENLWRKFCPFVLNYVTVDLNKTTFLGLFLKDFR